jgi:hypothetical protein
LRDVPDQAPQARKEEQHQEQEQPNHHLAIAAKVIPHVWLLADGYRLLAIGCWLSAIGYWLLAGKLLNPPTTPKVEQVEQVEQVERLIGR